MCKGCDRCQVAKARAPRLQFPLQPKEVLGPLHTLSVDLIGPFPRGTGGKLYVLTMVDIYTRYVVLAATQSITADTVADLVFDQFRPRRHAMRQNGPP